MKHERESSTQKKIKINKNKEKKNRPFPEDESLVVDGGHRVLRVHLQPIEKKKKKTTTKERHVK